MVSPWSARRLSPCRPGRHPTGHDASALFPIAALQVLRLDEFEYGNISFGQFLAW
jgi:hypothetical protein